MTETQSLKDTGRRSIPLRRCRSCALSHAYCFRKIYARKRTVCENYHHSLTRAVRNGPLMVRIPPTNADQRNRLSFNKLLIIPSIWSRWSN